MTRKALLTVEIKDSLNGATDEEILSMLKENEEGSSVEVTKVSMLDEACLMDLLLKHGKMLACFNCGRNLTEIDSNSIHRHGKDRFIANLILEPGEINYPREPDIPACLYFVCSECAIEQTSNEEVF
ncbi:MAG: hypothetical protein OIN86_10165 [Candidatus Methanoperedens sp.]|nr:hypothetical protein [Candidatus Methanoperedens sp.]CAG0970792.1 hypothetical protein METP1_01229 [Methanosarcinales archaeon]